MKPRYSKDFVYEMRSPNKKNQTTQLRTLNAANEALSVEKVLEWCQLAITTDVNDIDFRPIWKILTDNNGEVELIQILREMPQDCWLEECINEAQRQEWKSLKNIGLEAHEYLVYSHLNCKFKKFILKDFYADLTDWYLSFYDIIRYGFHYIQRFTDQVEQGIEIELLESKRQRKRFSDLNKMLWQIRECSSKLQTTEDAFRAVVTEDFYLAFSATQKPVFRSQPKKNREMRRLDYQLRENPNKVSKIKKEKYQKELNRIRGQFGSYPRLRDLCTEACEHLAEVQNDQEMKKILNVHKGNVTCLDKFINKLEHPRYSKSVTMTYGKKC